MDANTELLSYLSQLDQRNLKTRREAIRSVVCILKEGDALAVDPLIGALSDDDMYIRIKAAKGLGLIRDMRGIEPLTNALKDLSVDVRIEAAKALELVKYCASSYPICNINQKPLNEQFTSMQVIEIKNIKFSKTVKEGVPVLCPKSQTEQEIQYRRDIVVCDAPHALHANDSYAKTVYSNYEKSSKNNCKIFIDEKINAKIDAGDFYYLGVYYPKTNLEKHNLFSSRILIVKSYRTKQTQKTDVCIDYFAKKIKAIITSDVEFIVCVVPSHNKGLQPSGIRKIAESLCIPPIIDGTRIIERKIDLLEKHLGGLRDIKLEMDSIAIAYQEQIMGKPVLLLDDITTTGISFYAAKKKLLDNGADCVAPLALGKTYSIY